MGAKSMHKRITILILILITFFPNIRVYGDEEYKVLDAKAIVSEIIKESEGTNENIEGIQYVKLKILSGKYKGKVVDIQNTLSGNKVFDLPVKEGDRVMVMIEEIDNDNIEVNIADYARDTYIYMLAIIFFLILVVVGGMKGLKTIITLGITLFMIFYVLLPAMLKGYNPLLMTVLISTFVTIITIIIISGFSTKSMSAIIGTVSGVIIAGTLAFIVGSKVKLTGLSNEEAAMLIYIPQNISFNFRELLFSGILLGALGAVMDVSMSISSSVEEIHRANPLLSKKDLFLSGMNVGKDIMGTMSNTLILAYTGSSIPLILLFMAYDISFIKIVNMDLVATEIIRSISGSIGLIVTIPITAFTSMIFTKNAS